MVIAMYVGVVKIKKHDLYGTYSFLHATHVVRRLKSGDVAGDATDQ